MLIPVAHFHKEVFGTFGIPFLLKIRQVPKRFFFLHVRTKATSSTLIKAAQTLLFMPHPLGFVYQTVVSSCRPASFNPNPTAVPCPGRALQRGDEEDPEHAGYPGERV